LGDNGALHHALAREAATREILEVISQSRDSEQPVFDVIIDRAAALCAAETARLLILNEAGTHIRLSASCGSLHSFSVGHAFHLNEPGPASQAIKERRAVVIDDLAKDALYLQGDPVQVRIVEQEGVRSRVAVPLIRGDRAIGAITVNRHDVRPFNIDEVQLLCTFATQAVIAIENVRQFRALAARTEEVQALNASLESRVASQVDELERLGRLRRFLSPQVAEAVISSGNEKLLGSHRALIAILFADIRGFTAFCEAAEPEEAIEVLEAYHRAMGKLIQEHGAGVDHRAGDGIMVIFNDPLPCDHPAGKALTLALAMRARMAELCADWRKLGHRLGFGVGISLGYATVGMVGFEGRFEYTASGTAVNLASRLCDEAADGEILLSPRAYAAVEDRIESGAASEVTLKGFSSPVDIFRVARVKS